MKTKPSVLASILFAILCVAILAEGVNAQARGNARDRLGVKFDNGLFVAFESQMDPPGFVSRFFGTVTAGPKVVHRVIIDAREGSYIGYDVQVEPVGTGAKIEVTIKPLDPAFERTMLEDRASEPEWFSQHPVLRAFPLPRYPKPQVIQDGDTIALDMLVNRETGKKLVDLVKISLNELRVQEPAPTEEKGDDFTIEDVRLNIKDFKLLIDGKWVAGGGRASCSGPTVWFYTPERGLFVFSAIPRKGYHFQKIGLIRHNKIIFSLNGEEFELDSSAPILENGGTWNLWVLTDPNYKPPYNVSSTQESLTDQQKEALRVERGLSSDADLLEFLNRSHYLIGAASKPDDFLPKK